MSKTWEEMSELEQLCSIHYDMYKDVHGIRPRWFNYEAMTLEQINKELDQLQKDLEVEMAREKEAQAIAIREFEELVQNTIETGARTRENALRWIAEAEQYNGDWVYICYHYGLPYSYFKNVW